MLLALDFEINADTVHSSLAALLHAHAGFEARTAGTAPMEERSSLEDIAWYLAELALLDPSMWRYAPSHIAKTAFSLSLEACGEALETRRDPELGAVSFGEMQHALAQQAQDAGQPELTIQQLRDHWNNLPLEAQAKVPQQPKWIQQCAEDLRALVRQQPALSQALAKKYSAPFSNAIELAQRLV